MLAAASSSQYHTSELQRWWFIAPPHEQDDGEQQRIKKSKIKMAVSQSNPTPHQWHSFSSCHNSQISARVRPISNDNHCASWQSSLYRSMVDILRISCLYLQTSIGTPCTLRERQTPSATQLTMTRECSLPPPYCYQLQIQITSSVLPALQSSTMNLLGLQSATRWYSRHPLQLVSTNIAWCHLRLPESGNLPHSSN